MATIRTKQARASKPPAKNCPQCFMPGRNWRNPVTDLGSCTMDRRLSNSFYCLSAWGPAEPSFTWQEQAPWS
jgi:hypothetical protein